MMKEPRKWKQRSCALLQGSLGAIFRGSALIKFLIPVGCLKRDKKAGGYLVLCYNKTCKCITVGAQNILTLRPFLIPYSHFTEYLL